MINHITKIYNKDFFEKNRQVTVNEQDKKATINNITFINADEFIKIDVEFLQTIDNALSPKQLCNNFPKCQELTLRQIADGIFLAKINKQWFLMACELKSTLNSSNFIKAKAQLETTVFN